MQVRMQTWMSVLAAVFIAAVARSADLDPKVEARVESILSQMTEDEKLDYIGGYKDFNVMPIPRLGLPELVMSDGPAGVRNFGPTTAYPAPICLAATWNLALASEYGKSIGRDARARGVHIWLGPGVNLVRQPQGGRNFEYLGEDPFLTTEVSTRIIQGVQDYGVVATVKHFAANEQEHDRHTVSSEVDERTLREIYLKPFHAAVTRAHVWSVMSSYNRINGVHASENGQLIVDILKGEWGFVGPIMSDWESVYSTLGPVKNGLDLEMPRGKYMNRSTISPLLASGEVTWAMIDDKVRRILRMAVSMGFLDRPQKNATIPLDDPTSSFAALQIAREGTVLLKNENNTLPLDRAKVKRVLVVGPNATPAVTGGGGSSFTTPLRSVELLQAIRDVAGPNIAIDYTPVGVGPEHRALLWDRYYLPGTDDKLGIRVEYFSNTSLDGQPVAALEEKAINNEWNGSPAPGIGENNFSVRWTTRIKPDSDGAYSFVGRSDDGMRAFLDDQPLFSMWHDQGATRAEGKADLRAGQWYNLRVEYYQSKGGAVAQFGIASADPDKQPRLSDADLASADAVVACVGFDSNSESEGFDRPFGLRPEQEAMLRNLTSRHKRVIVVVNAGASIDAAAWVGKAGAMLMAWYPGQNGNKAIAEMLFGITNPSGKLPVTFERDFAESYAGNGYPPKKNGTLRYEEGVFVGYRFFDKKQIKPLFPFGHGLSYTSFRFTNIKCTLDRNGEVFVGASVENTGKVFGEEVAQLYIRTPGVAVPRPLKELKGSERVQLRPGESKDVRFTVSPEELKYYDVAAGQWKLEPGSYEVLVGSSSAELPVRSQFELPHPN
ncbi:MAG: glycoside hydrolase family 3 C-terminal domain-containing protein [Phycisphaerales bacterium]